MNTQKIGEQIALLRKAKGITQAALGDRLGVTFQVVSKWERGETLPDTALLPALADTLESTIDLILRGGEKQLAFRGRTTIAQIREGLSCLQKTGQLLGEHTQLYRHAIRGINEGMNTDIEEAFHSDNIFEVFVAECAIQNMMAGIYIEPADIRRNVYNEHLRDTVLKYCERCHIK
ncbi:MAG: helix-turn-helix transcriptional regulator [Oscillospiraceae bacterium]|nr:helix-turn-helix transcriptional regulator [Oscillospiraceae bacterium]